MARLDPARQLRPAAADPARHARRHPHRAARVGDTLVADAICFDVAYDDGIHEQLGPRARAVTVQTSNAMFVLTSQIDQQFEICRLRALETGRYVLVAATNGVSGVIAPDGASWPAPAPHPGRAARGGRAGRRR